MYSNKENVNILTSLLVSHGVNHAVVCPGSRNAPIVHNLNESPDITCYSVTDERSAGFYALGMAAWLGEPVAVCVTSGTALLNLAPAVAEAFYQHVPLVVISADRPLAWIEQQDGQTLPQPDALGRFVGKAVSLPEPTNSTERWHCNRLVNEALVACKRFNGIPVHINVPISEPLFDFSVEALPVERSIKLIDPTEAMECYTDLEDVFFNSKRPMIVIGKFGFREAPLISKMVRRLQTEVTVVYECLSMSDVLYDYIGITSTEKPMPMHLDKALEAIKDDEASYQPDMILYIGGELISKKLKQFLRRCTAASTWIVNKEGRIYDTFMNLAGAIQGREGYVLENLDSAMIRRKQQYSLTFDDGFHQRWQQLFVELRRRFDTFEPSYSQMSAVKLLLSAFSAEEIYSLHAANSMSIRLVNLFATDYAFCNRGVNGIDGSLSTAAGCSLVAGYDVYCVIGDLSFFYDQNALWHRLGENFKVLLLNNGGGGIFQGLAGLQASDALRPYISAQHDTSARGICQQNNVEYLWASNESELKENMEIFVNGHFNRPVVFEVFTHPDEDNRVMNEYYQI